MGSDNQYLEINFTETKQTLDGKFTWYLMIKQRANLEKKGLSVSVWLEYPYQYALPRCVYIIINELSFSC